jgi:hypothetical protein
MDEPTKSRPSPSQLQELDETSLKQVVGGAEADSDGGTDAATHTGTGRRIWKSI